MATLSGMALMKREEQARETEFISLNPFCKGYDFLYISGTMEIPVGEKHMLLKDNLIKNNNSNGRNIEFRLRGLKWGFVISLFRFGAQYDIFGIF